MRGGGTRAPCKAGRAGGGAAPVPLRRRAHRDGALAGAQWLEGQPRGTRVVYPGLASHPQHDLAQAQMRNTSGMVTLQVGSVADGQLLAQAMIEKLRIVHYAVSLGHHRSLIFWMETEALMSSSFALTGAAAESYRAYAGDGVFRLSVGIEDPADLISDLAQVI